MPFSFTSFRTAAVAGRLGTRDAERLCEMERSCAIAKITMRTERDRMEIAINRLSFPKCWSEFCVTQKRHSGSPVHLPCWTSKPYYKLKSYEGFWRKRQQQPLELKSIADTSLPIFTPLPLPSLINGLKHSVLEQSITFTLQSLGLSFCPASSSAKTPW